MEKYQKSEELPPGLKYIPLTPRDIAIEHEIKLAQEVLRYPLSPKTRMSWERWLKELQDEQSLGTERYNELKKEINDKLIWA